MSQKSSTDENVDLSNLKIEENINTNTIQQNSNNEGGKSSCRYPECKNNSQIENYCLQHYGIEQVSETFSTNIDKLINDIESKAIVPISTPHTPESNSIIDTDNNKLINDSKSNSIDTDNNKPIDNNNNILKVNRYGQIMNNQFNKNIKEKNLNSIPLVSNNDLYRQKIRKEYQIEQKFIQVLKQKGAKMNNINLPENNISIGSDFFFNNSDMKSLIRSGIPDSFRSKLWVVLSSANIIKLQHPHIYRSLKNDNNITRDDIVKASLNEFEIQIWKDIPRANQEDYYFRATNIVANNVDNKAPQNNSKPNIITSSAVNNNANNNNQYNDEPLTLKNCTPLQTSLYEVCRAYLLYNPQLGYVQSMASIVCLFLLYLVEEDCFWLFERLLHSEKYDNLYKLFEPGFPLLFEYCFVHEHLLKKFCPKLSQHFQNVGMETTAYASGWYLTLLSRFPRELVLRIYDILLNEGIKIIHRIIIYFLFMLEDQLLKMGFEGIMIRLGKDFPEEIEEHYDVDTIINGAHSEIRFSRQLLRELHNKYQEKLVAESKTKKKR